MNAPGTFTGRTRRRTTHPWVRAGDLVARFVITAGGIGTIVAVLLVCVFLLAVALPLFQRPWIEPVTTVARKGESVAPGRLAHLGMDESGRIALAVKSDGGIEVFSVKTGGRILGRSAEETGLAGVSAIRVAPGGMDAVIGFDDGSHATGRFGLESTFLAASDVPAEIGRLPPGGAVAWKNDVIVHASGDLYATVKLVVEMGAKHAATSPSPIVDCDLTLTASGPLVALLAKDGAARIASMSSRRNFLTDEVVTTSVVGLIPAGDGKESPAAFVRVSELGDQVLLVAVDGTARRYSTKPIDAPRLLETVDVADGERTVTAVTRLYGGTAIAVGDDAGGVNVWFTTRSARDGQSLPEDGSTLTRTKSFDPPPVTPTSEGDAVVAIAPSPRSRLLAVAHASGELRLLHSTTRSEVVSTKVGKGANAPPLGPLAISLPETTLLAARGDAVSGWRFDAGYPEVTLGTLFGRIWYEQYPEPVHAWETTGHESFEPKYGLVPLVFGTIKATVYSMLFAAPIAILAAIYSSQFMQPKWKAKVKPMIEMMASLPSVVLGFFAGLVLAPAVEGSLMAFGASLFTVPLSIALAAHLWQLLPRAWRTRFSVFRFALVLLAAIPLGVATGWAIAKPAERWLFAGDVQAWLDGHGGSGLGGWVVMLLPVSAIAVMIAMGRVVTPALRQASEGWSTSKAAMVSLATFAAGVAATVVLAVAAGVMIDALRLDARGGLVGTYGQRNAFIVAIGMGFAIIPLIFTLADDALSSVPEHLRSASLGAGATPWQTAIRVTVPAAASGLFSAAMIGLGRAVGETMVVLMAAGNKPLIDWNVFNGFQTLSAAIATELPEAARGSAHYRILFLAALTLFAITFVVNTIAEFVRQRFRRRAHEL